MAGIIILLGILAYLKYCNFFIQNMNRIAMAAGKDFYLEPQKLLIPIGISFYTLEAIGYMADVYWGRIKASITGRRWHFSLDSFHRLWRDRSAAGRIQQMLSGNADRSRARIL